MKVQLFIFAAFLTAVLGACSDSAEVPAQPPVPSSPPPAAEGKQPEGFGNIRQRIDVLIVAYEHYSGSEAAEKELKELLTGDAKTFDEVLSYIKKKIASSEDPEVKAQLEKVIGLYTEWGITGPIIKKFPNILERLTSADREVRERMVKNLGESSHADVLTAIIRALGDRDDSVREEAMWAVLKFRPEAVEPLIRALEHNDPQVRELTAKLLGEIKDTRAVEPLIAALGDTEGAVRGEAAKSLGRIGDSRAVQPLITAFDVEEDVTVRVELVWALGWLGDPRAVEPLAECLSNNKEDREVRDVAARALGLIPDERVIGYLFNACTDSDEVVRKTAESAIGHLGANAVEPLAKLLSDNAQWKRKMAAWALGRIRDPEAVKPLVGALKDKEKDVRRAALVALAGIGGVGTVEPLIAALKDKDHYVRRSAVKALGRIGDLRAVEPLTEMVYDYDPDVQKSAVEALGELGDLKAVEPLIGLLKLNDASLRLWVSDALVKIGNLALEKLKAALKDEKDENTKAWVKRIIAKIEKE
jgi:HEAT repeat protein